MNVFNVMLAGNGSVSLLYKTSWHIIINEQQKDVKLWKNKHCCNKRAHKRQTMTHMQQRPGSPVAIDTFHRESETRKLKQWITGRKWTAAVCQDTFQGRVARREKTDPSSNHKVAHLGVYFFRFVHPPSSKSYDSSDTQQTLLLYSQHLLSH